MTINDKDVVQLFDGRIGRIFDMSATVNGLYAIAIKNDKQNIVHMIRVADIARIVPKEEWPKDTKRDTTELLDVLVHHDVTFKGELIAPRDKYIIMKTVEAILKSKKL